MTGPSLPASTHEAETGASERLREFVAAHTALLPAPLCPEIRLHCASELTALWEVTEGWLEAHGVTPPYWAIPWAGGQALARWVLDHPESVAGRTVLDAGCGGGICAIAAARAGAARVVACDVDALAVAATRLNAAQNHVDLRVEARDPFAAPPEPGTVVLAGDLWYERHLARQVTGWLRACARAGADVLLGDLGRAYFPVDAVEVLAWYEVATSADIEQAPITRSAAWRWAET